MATALPGISGAGGLAELLIRQSEKAPGNAAVVFGEDRWTYGELCDRARTVASQLASCGIRKGDRVALLFQNCPEYVAAFFGATLIGAVVVPINPLLKSEEIAHILSDSQARLLIAHERVLAEVDAAVASARDIERVLVCPAGEKALAWRDARFAMLTVSAAGQPAYKAQPIDPGLDLAVLVYTSGTTGKPKGAMLTHGNLFAALGSALDAFAMTEADSFLAVLPLCHIYGLTVVMLGMISRGGTLVVLEKFEARQALKTIERHRVTMLPAVPTMYQFMIMEMEKEKFDTSSVRLCLCGASSLPPELIPRIEAEFGAPLIEGYGMTETSCVASVNPIEGLRKPGSVGPDFHGVTVAVMDDEGRILPPGAENVGEIVVSGPTVMRGYFRREEASREAFRGQWFLTGDLGYKDEDGYLYIVGRKKELIIRGGQNIYPREVEEVIARMPAVAEVAVVGVPDRFMGERVKAVVVARQGHELSPDCVRKFCASHLAEYKVPRLVEFVGQLPRNSTGKVLKRLLV